VILNRWESIIDGPLPNDYTRQNLKAEFAKLGYKIEFETSSWCKFYGHFFVNVCTIADKKLANERSQLE